MSSEDILKLPNLQLIHDVKMHLTVEIGRTKMKIRDILDLSDGSIVELNKLYNDPVDVLVNGMLIAKGHVVAIDGEFGVKVCEIISPEERFKFILS